MGPSPGIQHGLTPGQVSLDRRCTEEFDRSAAAKACGDFSASNEWRDLPPWGVFPRWVSDARGAKLARLVAEDWNYGNVTVIFIFLNWPANGSIPSRSQRNREPRIGV